MSPERSVTHVSGRSLVDFREHRSLFRGSSAVEQLAVNQKVVGSIPTPGARLSTKGRTSGFHPDSAGSNPVGRSKFDCARLRFAWVAQW